MIEKSVRLGNRFYSSRGLLSTEDLYVIPLESNDGFSVDQVAKDINREIKQTEEESFVSQSKESEALTFKLDVIKHIIKVRQKEALEANEAANNSVRIKAQRERLLDAIESKKAEDLSGKTLDELVEMEGSL